MANFAAVRNVQELLASESVDSPYDLPTLFSDQGFFGRRRSKRRFKLLKRIDARLRSILKSDERVFFATTGTTVNLAEHFFVGWAAVYLNRRAIVFTNERVLLIQVNSRNRPRHLLSQIRYEEIVSLKPTWNGICRIKLRNGKKLGFQRVRRAERKFLHRTLKEVLVKDMGPPDRRAQAPEHLCPECHSVVPGFPGACPQCGVPFKSARTAALRSLIFPGLGDYYLGHRGFAWFELSVGFYVWLLLVIGPLITGDLIDPETGEILVAHDTEYWIGAALAIAIIHGFDAIVTHHFGKKGHYSTKPISSTKTVSAQQTETPEA